MRARSAARWRRRTEKKEKEKEKERQISSDVAQQSVEAENRKKKKGRSPGTLPSCGWRRKETKKDPRLGIGHGPARSFVLEAGARGSLGGLRLAKKRGVSVVSELVRNAS